ncbi:amidase family protein [Mesorhizobium sp. M0579]|uniref:amidase family protein n=1 Tax=Mesorhizobium sp. M0579 TaxID=2956962 RepID=UPI00333CB2E4
MDDGSLTGQARLLQLGLETPLTLVESALDRASASRGVFIHLMEAAARTDAALSSKRWSAGRPLSPFDGIPFAVKDLFDVAGTVTTAGSRLRSASPAVPHDCAIVQNLRRCGMIPIGKTNLSEFAFSGLGLNPHFGTPSPAGHEDRVPGGSSSGSAIALQRGIVTVALGTDTAGSMRLPAAFNGLVGFRPSTGRYDMHGVYPLATSFDVAGPMANNANDCAVMDALMRGVEPAGVAAPFPPDFIVDSSFLDDPKLQPAVRKNLLAFVARMESLGARIETRPVGTIACARAAIRTLGWLGGVEAAMFHRERLASTERTMMDPRIVTRLESAAAMPADCVATLRKLRIDLMQRLPQDLNNAVLILPTVPHVAPSLAPLALDDALFASINLATLSTTMIGSFLDMPGLAVPSGVDSDGLPTSVLLTAAFGCDDAVIAAGLWASPSASRD